MIGQHGVTTILNAAPGRADLGPELLDSVDILVVNETEAALLAGAGELVLTHPESGERAAEAGTSACRYM